MNDRFRFRAWNTKTHELKEVTAVILHPDQHGFSSTVEDKINDERPFWCPLQEVK